MNMYEDVCMNFTPYIICQLYKRLIRLVYIQGESAKVPDMKLLFSCITYMGGMDHDFCLTVAEIYVFLGSDLTSV